MDFSNNNTVPPIYDVNFIKSIDLLNFKNYDDLEYIDFINKKVKEILDEQDSRI